MSIAAFSAADIDRRIVFHAADEILEIDLAALRFTAPAEVALFYDRVEERIAESGEQLWFFLVNYHRTWIDSAVWFSFSQSGRTLNLAHSMGSVRFDPEAATLGPVDRAADSVSFDPNLFHSRDAALAHLRTLPSKRWKKNGAARPDPFSREELLWRVAALPGENIVDVNLSNLSFGSPDDVDAVYDFVEQQIAGSGRKWYFLVNHDGTEIREPARDRYSVRGSALNRVLLGSVGYASGGGSRRHPDGRGSGLRATRQDALEEIAAMKAGSRPER